MMYKFLITLILIFFINKTVIANVYQFSFESIDGKIIHLNSLRGKPLIIVNTASFCGYTYQYEQLQSLYDKYSDKNLIIIGIPSNDFGNQEFKENKKVKDFCEVNFNIKFKLSSITRIKGTDGHPLFKWIKKEAGYLAFPKWNFYKYLFNKDGQLVSWFSSVTKPSSQKFIAEVNKILN